MFTSTQMQELAESRDISAEQALLWMETWVRMNPPTAKPLASSVRLWGIWIDNPVLPLLVLEDPRVGQELCRLGSWLGHALHPSLVLCTHPGCHRPHGVDGKRLLAQCVYHFNLPKISQEF